MPVTLSFEIYEAFEKALGKEEARKVVKSLEAAISEATEYKWATTRDEIIAKVRSEIEALRNEFESFRKEVKSDIESFKKEVRSDIESFKKEIRSDIESFRTEVRGEIDTIKGWITQEFVTKELFEAKFDELRAEIKTEIVKLDRKFTIMFLILLFVIIFLNQQALEFIAKILGIVK
ncbi:Protein of unknown function (DUF1640) [Candidatus Kryptonium thompsonii]|mgnify:CR=1 FL=1|uniref:DUF1640 domain-containing protein n=1 Tax=Candidatus Kryptonium thompsonii TaxID=1633631 RepID=A0A0N7MRN2_9BACT|nr:coiled-coil domain-containing protein [Candidatus Kryptonium thompsoni]CUS77108.1 Protein of unknown function (DUF1640) [Candidatus Kryptonium thompsoni]CUS79837.1 Protein of unknown function (DUF1640) [Candidatus Kryptonium thompsoni]CUS79924.1 Protein of unknown function (DUF1640) [Candidatus Kryptonium thompsoni]CUS80398.1 Protein of unknown function (DUF1640) [Candidatus Kryptonium thompsoni]CUS82370.1 Protein of unknown function (DUF1640) [Candidatus Kryptonium thompsoni]